MDVAVPFTVLLDAGVVRIELVRAAAVRAPYRAGGSATTTIAGPGPRWLRSIRR